MNDYALTYNDMSYVTYTLSDEQYELIRKAMYGSLRCVAVEGLGILILTDVRSLILQKPEPIENESFTPDLTADEQEHIKYLKWAEQLRNEEPDETEYEGGMMP